MHTKNKNGKPPCKVANSNHKTKEAKSMYLSISLVKKDNKR